MEFERARFRFTKGEEHKMRELIRAKAAKGKAIPTIAAELETDVETIKQFSIDILRSLNYHKSRRKKTMIIDFIPTPFRKKSRKK